MAPEADQEETPISENPNSDDEIGEGSQADGVGDFEDEDEEEEEEEEEEGVEEEEEEEEEAVSGKSREARLAEESSKLESIFRRLASEKVKLRVHDVLIRGNTKTKDSLIEAELDAVKNATTMQELLKAAGIANHRFRSLDIFDSVGITLDSGPPELPGTVNVIVDVVETKHALTGDLGIFTKPEARTWSFEGSLKLKNLFGYGDIWDGSLVYGGDKSSEVSAGVSLPRFKGMVTPMVARVSLLSQDWLKFSSYKEQALGLNLGLISTKYHDLTYNVAWRTLTDPSQMSSRAVRRQLGHGLLSSLKYTFRIDNRNSTLRPTQGYAFISTSQIGGLVPDYRSLRFLRQEIDLRCAIPLGFYRTALNLGVSGGVIFPWGNGALSTPSSLPERFFLGGNASPVCTLGGPTTLLGFKLRGLGPSEPRRVMRENSHGESSESSGMDVVGGDLAVTAFADLSFDLPLKLFRDAGIHGHLFACAGNLTKLTENEFRNFSSRNFLNSFRSSAGFGIILPTKLFRMEVNYCYILKQFEHDRGRTGVQFCFSAS